MVHHCQRNAQHSLWVSAVPVMKLPKEETSTLSKDKWLISSNDIADYLETKHSASGQAKLGKHADIPDM